MRVAASILSWLGGLGTIIYMWVLFAPLFQPGTAWWLIPCGFTAFCVGILVWRELATAEGHKIGCGVCTLIFASVPGGILTLCLPDYYSSYRAPVRNYSVTSQPTTPKLEPIPPKVEATQNAPKENEYERKLAWDLCQGVITQEEYDRKMAILSGQQVSETSKEAPSEQTEKKEEKAPEKTVEKNSLDEKERIELIKEYKKLLDDGILTQDEFDEKKRALLK